MLNNKIIIEYSEHTSETTESSWGGQEQKLDENGGCGSDA